MSSSRLFSILTCILSCLLHSFPLSGQAPAPRPYDQLIQPREHKRYVEYLTHPLAEGRATGTQGSELVRRMIARKFEEFGLQKYRDSYTQSFKTDSVVARNIVGVIPAKYPSEEYVIVGAHYDHLGILDNKFYPGADNNASGVASLLNLARTFGQMRINRYPFSRNIIFVAFDANELNMKGSEYFVENMNLNPRQIACMINIDQIGCTFSPPGKDTNYVMVLGKEKLRKIDSSKIDRANTKTGTGLVIDYTFYNSPDFYKIFYRLSDHYSFAKKGIPAVLFTSGITDRTYKVTDLEASICYPVLTARTRLIYHFICELVR